MRDNNPPVRRGREGLAKTPPTQIVCDGCGRKDVPAVMRTLIEHPFAKVWTFCCACDPVLSIVTFPSKRHPAATAPR